MPGGSNNESLDTYLDTYVEMIELPIGRFRFVAGLTWSQNDRKTIDTDLSGGFTQSLSD